MNKKESKVNKTLILKITLFWLFIVLVIVLPLLNQ